MEALNREAAPEMARDHRVNRAPDGRPLQIRKSMVERVRRANRQLREGRALGAHRQRMAS
jgi:hypothetical protein